jgi:NitT/TauT family transport system ATP-binding protein
MMRVSMAAEQMSTGQGLRRQDHGDTQSVVAEELGFFYATGTEALRNVSFTVGEGSKVGIVGPSGCGKSTLLAILAGLQEPTTGSVWRAGHGAGRHPLSVVFQKDTLLPWLTVRDNVALYAKFDRSKREEATRRAQELIDMAGLDGFEGAYPYQLSGGMRRRVAFLAGAAPLPRLLLLDEPFSSLDEPSRVAIHQDVLRIATEFSMTVVLVTHDLAEAITLCDKIIILTSRPGSVFAQHTVPFGNVRNVFDLRHTPDFLDLYGTLWSELSLQIDGGRRTNDA